MRFRTKLLVFWGGVMLLMLGGAVWPVERIIRLSFDRMTANNFAGTRRSLQSFQAERFARMRQAGVLLMNIPELRALIAEQNYEISADNIASLQERLDSLRNVVGASFICVLDGRAGLIAQNHGSPWPSLKDVSQYVRQSPQAQALLGRRFGNGGAPNGEFGLWTYKGRLYQVVSVPLIFGQPVAAQAAPPDGALIMATALTDEMAADLGRSHACEVSFLAEGSILASSLPVSQRAQLLQLPNRAGGRASAAFDLRLGSERYRASSDPLIDAPSGTSVGTMLIQSSLAPEAALEADVFRSLGTILLCGLAAAGLISFVLSGAVTRPVQDLVAGARRVAGGDFNIALPVNRRDELGELATAFNEMVSGLRRQRELERVAEQSQAASRAKSEFLANMSHEIRTPLHGVLGITDLLLRTQLSQEQRKFVQLVKSSGEVLTTLINDLLDFSKIEAGKLELESIDFELRQVIGDVIGLMSQRAESKSLDLRQEIADDVPQVVTGDPTRIRQVLLNLVSNAIKFTQTGGVAICAFPRSRDDQRVTIEFQVRDTGIGIPPDRLDRLFKSFSQVDASTTRRYGGTGLGLAISKQLSELMGGSIGVRSEAGKGSTFWFTVVLTDQPNGLIGSTSDTGPGTTVASSQRAVRILLAEDNEINQVVACELLRQAGYRCDVASNGRQAVDASAETAYELILMDCQMPGMDGLQATREIRKREQSQPRPARRVPIVALTADASGVAREQCREAGMDAYCSKPFQPRELLETIAAILKESSNQMDPAGSDNNPAALPPAVPGNPPEETSPPIDLEALLRRCTGKASLAMTLLEKFQTQVSTVVAEMGRQLKAGNSEQLARASHGLKGTAGIMAADPLREAVTRLEELAKAGDLTTAGGWLDNVRREVDRCNAFLDAARQELTRIEQQTTGEDHARSDRR